MANTTQHLAGLLAKHFLVRSDVFAVEASWGTHCPGRIPSDSHQTPDEILEAHVRGPLQGPEVSVLLQTPKISGLTVGRFRVATYTHDPKGRIPWLCFDVDGGEHHAAACKNPEDIAQALAWKARDHGLSPLLEVSASGRGFHVWIPFPGPIPVGEARALGLGLFDSIPRGDGLLDLVSGGRASAILSEGVEVFPKAFRGDGPGVPLWLPWWGGLEGLSGKIVRETTAEVWGEYIPDRIETPSPDDLIKILAAFPPVSFWTGRKDPERPSKWNKRVKAGEASGEDLPASGESLEAGFGPWPSWKVSALAKVPLAKIFSPYLVLPERATSRGWLACRDPFSPSGDRTPSAGISDGLGEIPRGTFHSFRDARSLSAFDFLIETGQAKDFREALRVVRDASGVPFPAPLGNVDNDNIKHPSPASGAKSTHSARPLIVTTGQQLDDLVAASWKALFLANSPPMLFNRAGRVVLLRYGSPEGPPCIEDLGETGARGLLGRTASWFRRKGDDILEAIFPPKEVSADLLEFPHKELPLLEAVVSSPSVGPEGEFLSSPGYHPSARLFYHRGSLAIPPIRDIPTPEEIREAREFLLSDFLGDFMFAADADRAAALAALLTPLLRRAFRGPVPLFSSESPVQGSGKGLLVQALAIVSTGREVIPQRLPLEEEEVAKTLLSEISTGRPIVLLDNADNKGRRCVDSGTLEAVLTSEEWTGRTLGSSVMASYLVRAVFFITGVNLEFARGLIRRRVRIRIDPRSETPWTRTSFKRPGTALLRWAEENRGSLLAAAFTLIRAYFSLSGDKRPRGRSLGSYEAWSDLLGGILEVAGVPGFLGHLDDPAEIVVEGGSGTGEEWGELISKWWAHYGPDPTSAATLATLAKRLDLLEGLRGTGSRKSQETRLGSALKRLRGRVFSGLRVCVGWSATRKAADYTLEVLPGTIPPTRVSLPDDEF